MKKIQYIFLFVMILSLFSACGNTQIEQTGSTEEQSQSSAGGDLFSIQVADPYLADWDGCLNRANKEKADNVHPVLSKTLDNIEDYDIVFLGFPNWWYSCPMAIYSFIDEHNLSGKQIYLFCSHGTGGLASSVKDITAKLPDNAVISDNVFHVYQDNTSSAKNDVLNWLEKLDIK